MARGSLVRVDGIQELRRTLRRAGADMTQLKEINKAVAETAAAGARAVAPRRTGALADTIRTSATQKAGVLKAGTGYRGRTPYAGVIEWGWPGRNITADPFLTKGAQDTEDQWTEQYFDHLVELIESVRGV